MSRGSITRIAVTAAMALLALITVYPMVFVLLTSLKDLREFYANFWGPSLHPQWLNFAYAWSRASMGLYLQNSLIVSAASVLLITIIALMSAYGFAKLRFRGSALVFSILLATLMVPREVTLVPQFILIRDLSLLNTLRGLVIVYVATQLVLSAYIMKSFFQQLPDELIEAARLDGYAEASILWRIIVPLSRPVIGTVIIVNFVSVWGEFLWALITTTDMTKRTISVGLYMFQDQHGTDWGPFTAGVAIALVPIALLYMLLQRQFIRGLAAGAIKG